MYYAIANAICLCALSAESFRVLQGVSYRPQRGYVKVLASFYFAALVCAFGVALTMYLLDLPRYIATIIYAVSAVVFAVIPRKVRLKMTKRIWRMMSVCFALIFVPCRFGYDFAVCISLPLIALVSCALCLPIDVAVSRHYLRKAQAKLAQSGATVIAITGSYGKTSVKDMLSALLNDSASPSGSCNTPLGIASYLNRTDLTSVKYLILEFGARKKGDIAELCALFKPKYGIVTGVCPQHLSTFKTFDSVVATKRELVEGLPGLGVCVLNCKCPTALSYAGAGVCSTVPSNADLTVEVTAVTLDGIDVKVTADGEFLTRLPQITAHTADTLEMCMQLCLQLGQSVEATLQNVNKVRQTPHRMQLMKTKNCYILDDSYNGSITGVMSACGTLNSLDVCTKLVITQGLVECGKRKRELNVQCGQLLGKSCSVAIVTGGNRKYLAEGLSKTSCKVIFAKNLTQAVDLAQPYLRGNALLFFQNDLPDF